MKPRIKLAETVTADGAGMALYEHDGAYSISCRGQELMHSEASASEILLGQLGVERLEVNSASRILIGGLGLGFTLRSVLESCARAIVVEMVELLPEIVAWNREYLNSLNGALLNDTRVEVHVADVVEHLRGAEGRRYDVILLDIDNGPVAMVADSNVSLYSKAGLKLLRDVLKPMGRVVFWSAGPDLKFERRLNDSGFRVTKVPAKVHAGAKRAAYLLYIADNC